MWLNLEWVWVESNNLWLYYIMIEMMKSIVVSDI